MSDRFLQGFMEDFIRGVSSPITANVGGGSAVPANARYLEDATVRNLEDATPRTTEA